MRSRRFVVVLSVPLLLFLLLGGSALATDASHGSNRYVVTNLVSDQAGQALNTDPNLVNAWGLVAGPNTPWWVSDNGTDLSTIYDASGNIQPLVVQVASAPTGTVYNGSGKFVVSGSGVSGPALFLFSTEEGTILGWNRDVSQMQAVQAADRSDVGAIYKGLAIGSMGNKQFLYATDFHNGRIDMFDGKFKLVTPDGAFQDHNIPAHYAPFGIQNIGGVLFVTYAKQDADAEDEVAGPGKGFVDAFDLSGTLIGRVASRGALNAPWGLAMAPDGFGRFGGDLLVGNFGDGSIHAFARTANGWMPDGALRTRPRHHHHRILRIDGLWGIAFGNDDAAGPSTTLYFAAGPDEESHGLFGSITPAG